MPEDMGKGDVKRGETYRLDDLFDQVVVRIHGDVGVRGFVSHRLFNFRDETQVIGRNSDAPRMKGGAEAFEKGKEFNQRHHTVSFGTIRGGLRAEGGTCALGQSKAIRASENPSERHTGENLGAVTDAVTFGGGSAGEDRLVQSGKQGGKWDKDLQRLEQKFVRGRQMA
jgi:hypothetical protein